MRTEYKEGGLVTREDVGLVFKSRNGNEYKLIGIVKEEHPGDHVACFIDKHSNVMKLLTKNGKEHLRPSKSYDDDLVSFVGPDFTEDKKLRKFEFEAYVGENPTKENERIDPESSLDKTFGYPCGHKLVINKNSYHPHYQYTSKWKITMEELRNEN